MGVYLDDYLKTTNMKAQFIDNNKKKEIYDAVYPLDEALAGFIVNELQRLESVIRDYEIAIGIVIDKAESKHLKVPA